MLTEWPLLPIGFAYIALLFLLAHLGELRRFRAGPRLRPLIYALSLGVYCSSWSFLGTAGQAANSLYSYLPIYLGPMLLFLLAWPLLQRMIAVSHRLRLTSLADLIAARFGNSRGLAATIALVALVGTTPYLALQIKAIVYSIELLAPLAFSQGETALLVVGVLAAFTMLFGVRSVDVTERHPGLMLAVAFESVVKVAAFLLLGLFVVFVLYDSPQALWQAARQAQLPEHRLQFPPLSQMLASLLIVMAAFLCLPRQFHVAVVECRQRKDTRMARWLFPLYLLIFALFAAPLGLAGHLLLSEQYPADAYVLMLPVYADQPWLAVAAFLGTISAASSMVIVSSIALSTMLSNEILLPMLFRADLTGRSRTFETFAQQLVAARKLLVVVVMLLGYLAYRIAPPDTLGALGEMAFGAIAQLTPALLAAFFWRGANRFGVALGLIVGILAWLLVVAIPKFGLVTLSESFNPLQLSLTSNGTLLSLLLNALCLWLGSLWARPGVVERMQLGYFVSPHGLNPARAGVKRSLAPQEMQALAARFVGERRAKESFARLRLERELTAETLHQHTERLLTSVIGAASARMILDSALQGRDIALDEVARMMDAASSERIQFSRSLLQAAIENTSEGISVIDAQLRLVAWNQRYLELFNYPDEMICIGKPIEALIRYNAQRGLCGDDEIEAAVQKRVAHLRHGSAHTSERRHPDGRVIRIQGQPMPGGGFVMTFSDITIYREAERLLKETNLALESRVAERTRALEETNLALNKARLRAEQAVKTKSSYLRTCSHDLMQPLEAARLFSSALSQDSALPASARELVQRLNSALRSASDLTEAMGDVARIESGRIQAHMAPFPLAQLFEQLKQEFAALASRYDVRFDMVPTRVWVYSDSKLLRRVLQNLLGNAFRYAEGERVLLGCRRRGANVEIQVLDSGPGIAVQAQEQIFEPFTRLQSKGQGLGLGLSISRGLCELMGHQLSLHSIPAQGSQFAVTVARTTMQPESPIELRPAIGTEQFKGLPVLCVDNDPDVLMGMQALLQGWQCEVRSVASISAALDCTASFTPAILLVDYQLDNGEDGLSLIRRVRQQIGVEIAAILVTADASPELARQAAAEGVGFMRKRLKPAKLRALIQAQLDRHPQMS